MGSDLKCLFLFNGLSFYLLEEKKKKSGVTVLIILSNFVVPNNFHRFKPYFVIQQ